MDELVVTKKFDNEKVIIVAPSTCFKLSIIDLLAKIREYEEVKGKVIEELKKVLIENWEEFMDENVNVPLSMDIVLNEPIKVKYIRRYYGETSNVITISANTIRLNIDVFAKSVFLTLSDGTYNLNIPLAISKDSNIWGDKGLSETYMESIILNMDKLQLLSKYIKKELEEKIDVCKRIIKVIGGENNELVST